MTSKIASAALSLAIAYCSPAVATSVTTLAVFDGQNGGFPHGSLIADASGTLYGTTSDGGAYGFGTVFSLTQGGALKTLASFGGANGARPFGSLIADTSGNFYGTTYYGGTKDYGTVFKLTKSGILTTVVSFDYFNGAHPRGSLIADKSGKMYGTTFDGGTGSVGTVFSLTSSGLLTTLANFDSTSNGEHPSGSLLLDPSGTLFGTTTYGNNYGSIFSLTKSGSLKTIANLGSGAGAPNGSFPVGSLIVGPSGLLYGTASNDGDHSNDGTIFSVNKDGILTRLLTFYGINGSHPHGVTAHEGGAGGLRADSGYESKYG